MKIVLINPRKFDTPNHPLGLLYIASILEEEGHEVVVLDPAEKISNYEVAKNVLSYNPDWVGLTSTTPQIIRGLDIAREIKKISSVPILFGGVHPTLLIKEVLKNDFVDFVVFGEGEETVREFVKAFENKKPFSSIKGLAYKVNNQIKINAPRSLISNLDGVPFPARHLLNSKWYFAPPRLRGTWTKSTATIATSRGCPYRCIWCGSHLMFGRKVRRRSVKNVIEEIIQLKDDFDIDSIRFVDDTFTVNPKWVISFCKELKKLKLPDFKWGCTARVNTVSLELLNAMKEAGCIQLDFGVESGSQRVLDILKKDIGIKTIINAFDLARKVGLKRFASFIIGTPGEKKEDIILTSKLIDRIKPDYTEFFFATPYPGTELYEIVERSGVFDKVLPFDQWISSKQSDKPIMCIGFTEEELIKYRSMLHNKVVFKNYLTMLEDTKFLLGGLSIVAKGKLGFIKGIKRFVKTGKIDSIFVEVLATYRNKLKKDFY